MPFPRTPLILLLALLSTSPTLNAQDCAQSAECCSPAPCCTEGKVHWLLEELTIRLAVDGSKQPQDFGVNANLGGQASVNWGLPLAPQWGVGMQIGTGITATANAVRVYELVGESTSRTQSFSTVGFFQRTDMGFSWGFVHDFLSEEGFDDFSLGQWRTRFSYDLGPSSQIGVTGMLKSYDDDGVFGGATNVTLRPIDQAHVYWRQFWETGAQTTFWMGVAEGHGEDNAVTLFSPPQDEVFLFGADFLMPLNNYLSLYGETNMIMPPDTGTVDAFVGIQWHPGGGAFDARRRRFSPLLPLASPVSFAADLIRQ